MTVSRSPRRRRLVAPLALTALVFATVRCGFLASPGEYTGGEITGDGSLETSTLGDSSATDGSLVLSDGNVIPQSIGTIAIMAGARDPSSPDDDPAWSADAWSGVLDSKGHVATWRIEPSAPAIGPFDSSGLVGTKWMTINAGGGPGGKGGTALQNTSWVPGIAGDWVTNNALGAPGGLAEFSRAFYGTRLVYIGGSRTVPVDGGGTNTFLTQEVHTSTVDPAANTLSGSDNAGGVQLLHARARPALALGKTSLYVVGGRTNAGFSGSVEMAPVDVTAGTFQAFVDQPTMMTGGAEHKVYLPGAVVSSRGFLFVAGGRSAAANAPPTDVVLSASVDGTTGALGTFTTLNKLPAPLYNHALVAFKGRLYVIGGVGTTTRSDKVYSASINADGTIGDWDTDAKLPAARSDFAALAY